MKKIILAVVILLISVSYVQSEEYFQKQSCKENENDRFFDNKAEAITLFNEKKFIVLEDVKDRCSNYNWCNRCDSGLNYCYEISHRENYIDVNTGKMIYCYVAQWEQTAGGIEKGQRYRFCYSYDNYNPDCFCSSLEMENNECDID